MRPLPDKTPTEGLPGGFVSYGSVMHVEDEMARRRLAISAVDMGLS